MMLDRLIELLKKARMEEQAACLCACLDDVIDMPRGDEYIADYLLAHGVIVPPCKVGDTVYQVDAERVYPSVVKAVIYDTDGIAFDERAIHKTVFLTREEAEQALKERDGYTFYCDDGNSVFLSRKDADSAMKEDESND